MPRDSHEPPSAAAEIARRHPENPERAKADRIRTGEEDPVVPRQARPYRSRQTRRPRALAPDSDSRQGNAAATRPRGVSAPVLLRAGDRHRRILALGRVDRHAGVLSAHPRGHPLWAARLGAVVSLHGDRAGRPLPHRVSDRHSSGRAGVGAQRAPVRGRHDLGRRRQRVPLGGPAHAHPNPQADRIHGHEQLRAASCEPRGGDRHRSRGVFGAQGRVLGGDAV